MFFLYSILFTVAFIALIPLFLWRREKYAAGFWQRFGYLPEFKQDGRPVLWLHSVSVGETQAARPLAKRLTEEFPEYRLVVSTTTKTGQELAQEVFKDAAELVFYFPYDWRFTVRRSLEKIKPNVVLLMETEIWFNFIREAGKSNTRVFIVNGRLSEKSLKRYLRIRTTLRRVLHYVDMALMQSSADARRLLQLDIRSNKVKITGNIKFDQSFDALESVKTDYFRERFAVSEDAPLIVAASTHASEENWILEAFKTIWKSAPDKLPRLLIAPRHPERFDEVSELIKQSGFEWVKRSEEMSDSDKTAEVILLDTIGELRAVFPLAGVVFIGGSLIPHGGHSILEPAVVEKPIVTGFYTMNFDAVVKEFLEKNAVIQLPKLEAEKIPPKLAEVFLELLQNSEYREKLAQNALAVMQKNRGAVEKTIEHLKPFL
ncbi:MAG TPA: 3-deoxy-D-manno-octulosonic acid transferase, partial [Pyrinomonadaceae bacterium]|nr:3-deoxy-D-manno-octulosonic acid transferase [Pyrinomonadaceae bacterium]